MNQEKSIAERTLQICELPKVKRLYRRAYMGATRWPEYEDFTQELVRRLLVHSSSRTEYGEEELHQLVYTCAKNLIAKAKADKNYISLTICEYEPVSEDTNVARARELIADLMHVSPKLAHILCSRAHNLGSHADFAALVGRHLPKLKPKQRQRVQALLARINHIAGDEKEAV